MKYAEFDVSGNLVCIREDSRTVLPPNCALLDDKTYGDMMTQPGKWSLINGQVQKI